jgi:glucose/arabinose dehydrogenase
MVKKQFLKNLQREISHLFNHNRKNYFVVFLVFAISIITIGSFNNVSGQEFENYKVETIAENLEIPWEIVFAPDGRIFFTERVGNLRLIEDGQLNPEPVTSIDVGIGEGGLLGLELDPNFEQNHYLYLYYTYFEFPFTYNKVVRYIEKDNVLDDGIILVDKIPGAAWHDGGRIKFGPDEKLYITTGDAGNADSAQDLNSLAGKILRINSDGTIPSDNPFSDSSVFSYGHRNPQGLDWDPITGKLVITEHGPSGERGFAHDEINVIEPGKNYGWPKVIGGEHDSKFVDPILHTGDNTWAPSGASFYDSQNIPEWENKYFVATLRGSHLRMLDLNLESNQVVSNEPLFSDLFGRLRDATMGPDGNLYLLTSNRDGRGSPAENDDRILKIIPIISEEKKIGNSSISPLKQVNEGVLPKDVVCKIGLELILKSNTGNPACVTPETASKLVSMGWGIWP